MITYDIRIIAFTLLILTGSAQAAAPGPPFVDLGTAGNFVILSKAGITDVPNSAITGDIGTSPITGAADHVTCTEVTGKVYSVDTAGPSPCNLMAASRLSVAIGDMQTAYTDAAGRTVPDFTELGAGNIGGLTLIPGLYKWGTDVIVPVDVTIAGGPNDVWIFQIAGILIVSNGVAVHLSGGAQAKNIFWQVAGQSTLGTTSHFEGIILCQTTIAMQTGASINGRLFTKTDVTLQMNTVKGATSFADVLSTDYYFPATQLMFSKGISAGCATNPMRYCPQDNMTRGQMAVFIARSIYGSDTFTYVSGQYFSDVPSTHSYYKWVQKIAELGITSGCGGGAFCPDVPITREQMSVFIIRARYGTEIANGLTGPTTAIFADVPPSSPYFNWIQLMSRDKITAGCGSGLYCPGANVIRGDAAISIMRGEFNELLPAGTAILTQISPATLTHGTTATFTITGANTNFVQGTTVLSPQGGVTIGTVTVTSPTTLTVQLTAPNGAWLKPYSMVATTGSEQAVLPNGLVIQ